MWWSVNGGWGCLLEMDRLKLFEIVYHDYFTDCTDHFLADYFPDYDGLAVACEYCFRLCDGNLSWLLYCV